MRTPRAITWLVLVVAAPQLTGCYTFKPYGGDLPGSFGEIDRSQGRDRFRVVTQREFTMDLNWVWEQDQMIHGRLKTWNRAEAFQVYGEGLPDSTMVAIPLLEVREIEKRRVDPYVTALAFAAAGALVLTFYLLITFDFMEGWDFTPDLNVGG